MHNARFKDFEISRKPIKNIISGDLEAQDPLAAARAETWLLLVSALRIYSGIDDFIIIFLRPR